MKFKNSEVKIVRQTWQPKPNVNLIWNKPKDGDVDEVYYCDGESWHLFDVDLKIPPATTNTIGGVKIGDGISVTQDGTISVQGGDNPIGIDTTIPDNPVDTRVPSTKLMVTEIAQLEQDVKGINTEITEMWEAINSGEEGDWYGVTRKTSQASPDLTRIGNMNNHRILPFHNRIAPCIVDKDRNVVYWLDRQDIRKKADGTPAKLDGTDGQCCVYVPAGYYLDHAKGKDYANQDMDNDITAIGLRPFSYMGEYAKYFPAFFVSMDICTVQRSTNKLMCCYNDTADFAGSGSKATAGGVGKARTALNHDTYFNYARNYGSGWTNTYYPAWQIISALMRIEYATYNLKKPMIKDKTDEGYTQGGLGEGPINWTSQEWSDYNGDYPVRNILDTHISACDQQSMFGIATDGTHIDRVSFRIGDTTKYTEFNTWRWIGNIWGHIWHHCCGVYVHTQGSADGNENILYVANSPDDCISAASSFDYISRYKRVGIVPRAKGYIKEAYPYVSISNTLGAGSSTYMCAHWWGAPPTDPAISETRCLLLGASLNYGGSASRSAAVSDIRLSAADSDIGSGLFAYVNK